MIEIGQVWRHVNSKTLYLVLETCVQYYDRETRSHGQAPRCLVLSTGLWGFAPGSVDLFELTSEFYELVV